MSYFEAGHRRRIEEDEAVAELRKLHGIGEVEAFHMLEVMRGRIGNPYPSPEDPDSDGGVAASGEAEPGVEKSPVP